MFLHASLVERVACLGPVDQSLMVEPVISLGIVSCVPCVHRGRELTSSPCRFANGGLKYIRSLAVDVEGGFADMYTYGMQRLFASVLEMTKRRALGMAGNTPIRTSGDRSRLPALVLGTITMALFRPTSRFAAGIGACTVTMALFRLAPRFAAEVRAVAMQTRTHPSKGMAGRGCGGGDGRSPHAGALNRLAQRRSVPRLVPCACARVLPVVERVVDVVTMGSVERISRKVEARAPSSPTRPNTEALLCIGCLRTICGH